MYEFFLPPGTKGLRQSEIFNIFKCKFHQQTKSLWEKIKFSKIILVLPPWKSLFSTIIFVSNFVLQLSESFYRYMTYIRFFFVLYWVAPFLMFRPLPSKNPRCTPVLCSLYMNCRHIDNCLIWWFPSSSLSLIHFLLMSSFYTSWKHQSV